MVKQWGVSRLYLSYSYSCTLYFLEKTLLVIISYKEPLYFSMFESKLRHNKAVTKSGGIYRKL